MPSGATLGGMSMRGVFFTLLLLCSPAYSQPPIQAIYLHLEYNMTGIGGSMTANYEPYVLLRDGTITDDLSYYPQTAADLPKWRARKPRAWGVWNESGAEFQIRWNDPRRKPERWTKWFVARPGADGMALSGLYRSMGGAGNSALGGNATIAAWKHFEFSPDGTLASGGGSGSHTDGPGGSVATSSRQRSREARYRIQGYSIQLESVEGLRETRWFYRFPDNDDAVGVGSGIYSRKKKTR